MLTPVVYYSDENEPGDGCYTAGVFLLLSCEGPWVRAINIPPEGMYHIEYRRRRMIVRKWRHDARPDLSPD